jgi:hypothetical protein
MIRNDTQLNNDLRAWAVRTPAAHDVYKIMLDLAPTHGRCLAFDNIRARTPRSNNQIRVALNEIARAGLCIVDKERDEVTVIV